MDCPRCRRQLHGPNDGPYRGSVEQSVPVALVPKEREGVMLHHCPACDGAFIFHDDLRRIERPRRSAADIARRAYAPAFEAIHCVACGTEMNRREWSMNTLVFVDVCSECRGVWLDAGELEALTGK